MTLPMEVPLETLAPKQREKLAADSEAGEPDGQFCSEDP